MKYYVTLSAKNDRGFETQGYGGQISESQFNKMFKIWNEEREEK